MADDAAVETEDALDTTEPIDHEQNTASEPTAGASTGGQRVPEADASRDESDENGDMSKGAREAAKYRTRLRETETERDALAATVERLQRRDAERIVGERLSVPADLFDLGQVSLADLLNEEGDVEPALVDTALLGLLEQRPGLAKPAPRQKYPSGIGLGNRGPGPAGTSWGDVLNPR